MNPNDFFDIEEDWSLLIELVNENNPDMRRFLDKKGKNASVRARNRLNEIRKLCESIRKKILKQRKINDSDYS